MIYAKRARHTFLRKTLRVVCVFGIVPLVVIITALNAGASSGQCLGSV
jgi:hypothetical protein